MHASLMTIYARIFQFIVLVREKVEIVSRDCNNCLRPFSSVSGLILPVSYRVNRSTVLLSNCMVSGCFHYPFFQLNLSIKQPRFRMFAFSI